VAHHKSALKRIKQNERRRLRNKHAKTTVRSAVKKVRVDIGLGNASSAQEKLAHAQQLLDRVAGKGIIPKKRASRLNSRLQKAINRLG
jgi:small subunit ribosomal protein S20